jgi:tetratricopeptide (TPR) repeat protein
VQSASLTTKEAELLAYLSAQCPRTVSREELLTQVWGYAPGVNSRAVDKTMNRLRGKVEQTPASPTHLISEHGAGYRLVLETRTSLLGRQALLQQLRNPSARMLLLLGPGGVGKSTIARELDGVFCALASVLEPEDLLPAIGRAMGLAAPTPQNIEMALAERLLILDNVEHLAQAVQALVNGWAESGPRVLLTSRVRLDCAQLETVSVPGLKPEDAVSLLALRSSRELPLEQAQALVTELDGLPLAIELAAARLRTLSVADLRERLRPSMLRGDGAFPERHRTLEGVLQDSWTPLSERHQQALVQCAACIGGFDLCAAEAMLGPKAELLLEDLCGASLIQATFPQGEQGRTRYHLHAMVRHFVLEQGEPDLAAHAAYYLQWGGLQRAELRGPRGPQALRAIQQERANLLAALPLDPLAGFWGLTAVLKTQGPLPLWLDIANRVLQVQDTPRVRLDRAEALLRSGKLAQALEDCRLAERSEEPWVWGMAKLRAAFNLDLQGLHEEAQRELEAVIARAQETGEDGLLATARTELGIHLYRVGRSQDAIDSYLASEVMLEQQGNLIQLPITRLNLAHALDVQGAPCAHLYESVAQAAAELSFTRLEAVALLGLSDHRLQGAQLALERVVALGQGMADRELMGTASARLGVLAHRAGDLELAQALYAKARRALTGGTQQTAESRWLLDALEDKLAGRSPRVPTQLEPEDAPDLRRLRSLPGDVLSAPGPRAP